MWREAWHNYPFIMLPMPIKALLAVLIVWSIIWKGIALWKAARNSDKVWYIVLLVVNTIGILEIIYIFGFSKKGNQTPSISRPM